MTTAIVSFFFRLCSKFDNQTTKKLRWASLFNIECWLFFCCLRPSREAMKHKSSKRAISNKQCSRDPTCETQTRRFSSSSTPTVSNRRQSTDQVELGSSTVQADSRNPCFKANLTLKSQKLLKRDLLRCSDQRPTCLGSQILPTLRSPHPSLHKRSTQSSSVDRLRTTRRRSLFVNTGLSCLGAERIGPWPDTTIGRLRSDGTEFLQPLKICHSLKKPRVCSPKSSTGSSENTEKFKFYSSTDNYIEEYRKQKGYRLETTSKGQGKFRPVSNTELEVDHTSPAENTTTIDSSTKSVSDSLPLPMTDLSLAQARLNRSIHDLAELANNPPSIPSLTKILSEPYYIHNFPAIAMRNGHLRPARHPPHHPIVVQQSTALPRLTGSSLNYINSLGSVEKPFPTGTKASMATQSKLFFIQARRKKRYC